MYCLTRQHGTKTTSASPRINLIPAVNGLRNKRHDLVRQTQQRGSIIVIDVFVGPLRFNPRRSLTHCPRAPDRSLRVYRRKKISMIFVPAPRILCNDPGLDLSNLARIMPPATVASILYNPCHPNRFRKITAMIAGLLDLITPSHTCFNHGSTRRLTVLGQLTRSLGLPKRLVKYPAVQSGNNLTLDSHGTCLGRTRNRRTTTVCRTLLTTRTRFRTKRHQNVTLLDAIRRTLTRRPTLRPRCIRLIRPSALTPLRAVRSIKLLTMTTRLKAAQLVSGVLLQRHRPVITVSNPTKTKGSAITHRITGHLGLLCLSDKTVCQTVA